MARPGARRLLIIGPYEGGPAKEAEQPVARGDRRAAATPRARVNQTRSRVATRLGDRGAQAQAYTDLGLAYCRQGRYAQALDSQQRSLSLYEALGDRRGQAASLNKPRHRPPAPGTLRPGAGCQRRSLAVKQELGDPTGEAESLRELGGVLQALGRSDQARASWQQALGILERLHSAEADTVRAMLAAPDQAKRAGE